MGPVHILKQLENAGHEAYFVGGCVRDTLLKRPVHDWDIATSATPEEVMAVFSHTVPTGLKHGTVTVVEGGAFEVTTFRCDGDYLDGRHPDAVTFVRSLREDLSRRDFTVNAMAMDAEGDITDLFGGREDLQRRIIRCVGEPEKRFREDALRILRAFRFSAQLGFAVEQKTLAATARCAHLCGALSAERVREEVEKTLLSPSPQTAEELIRLGILQPFGMAEPLPLSFLRDYPAEAVCRWTGLFFAYPQADWENLRLDKKTGKTAKTAAAYGNGTRTALQWKGIIAREGAETARCAACLAGQLDAVERILSSGEPIFLRDLAVDGNDFPHLPGKARGELLQRLLSYVHAHPEKNEKEILLQMAAKGR